MIMKVSENVKAKEYADMLLGAKSEIRRKEQDKREKSTAVQGNSNYSGIQS